MKIMNVKELKGKLKTWAELTNLINDLRDEVNCDPECNCTICTSQYERIFALEKEQKALGITPSF